MDRHPFIMHRAGFVLAAGIFVASVLFPTLIVADPVIGASIFAAAFVLLAALLRIDAAFQLSLAVLFLFYRFEIQYLGSGKLYADVLILSPAFLVIVYFLWQLRRGGSFDNRTGAHYAGKLILLLTAWCVVTLLWTKDMAHGLVLTINMAVNLMLVQLFTVYISNHEKMRRMIAFLIILGCVLGTYTVATKFYQNIEVKERIQKGVTFVVQSGGEGLGNSKRIRANGFTKSDVAAFGLNFFIFITLAVVISGAKSYKRLLAFLALCFLFICVLLAASKGALLGLALGFPAAILINPEIRPKRIKWLTILSALLVFAFFFNYVVFQEKRIARSFSGGTSTKIASASFSTRLAIWKVGFTSFFETYGYGLGNGTSAVLAQRSKQQLPHMHSFFFSALFDLGLVGLALLMAILVKIGIRLNQARVMSDSPFMRTLASCLAGSLIAAMAQGALISEYTNYIFWVILGFIIAVTSLPFSLVKGQSPAIQK